MRVIDGRHLSPCGVEFIRPGRFPPATPSDISKGTVPGNRPFRPACCEQRKGVIRASE